MVENFRHCEGARLLNAGDRYHSLVKKIHQIMFDMPDGDTVIASRLAMSVGMSEDLSPT